MGVDVNLYAQGSPTPEQVDAARALLVSRLDRFVWREDDGTQPALTLDPWADEERWEVQTGSRYYGRGYERGHWPDIYAAILCLRATLPGCTIHYGGDSDLDSPEVTDEYLAEIWHHWLGKHGDDYRTRS